MVEKVLERTRTLVPLPILLSLALVLEGEMLNINIIDTNEKKEEDEQI